MNQLTKGQIEYCVAVITKTIDQREYNQKQMEQLSGVPQPTISKILTRSIEPTYEVLGKLLQALGLTFRTVLFDMDGSPHDMLGYLATPLTGVVNNQHAEAELNQVVGEIKAIAGNFQSPPLKLYWPGDHTHPSKNPDFSPSQVYLTDRSRASTHDFIVLFCGAPSYGVGQENEIAAQAGLPAVRLVPQGISRMMSGSFINTIDVRYSGDLASHVEFDSNELHKAFERVRTLHFRHLAFFSKLNGNGFGEKLRGLVDARCGGDYKTFADDIGISLSYLIALMDERIVVSNPSLALLKRMASRLDTTVAFLTGETDEADPVYIASHASWRDWISSTSVDAKLAVDLRDEWRNEHHSQKIVATAASFRKQSNVMTVSDWDKRYQKSKAKSKNATGKLF